MAMHRWYFHVLNKLIHVFRVCVTGADRQLVARVHALARRVPRRQCTAVPAPAVRVSRYRYVTSMSPELRGRIIRIFPSPLD